MEHDIPLNAFIGFMAKQDMKLNTKQVDRLNKYVILLHSWKNKINLISKGDYQYLWERHILISMHYAFLLKNQLKPTDHIVDMGSGAGFPGMILSIMFPDNLVTMIDSSRKKTLFLRNVQKRLGLNANIYNERLELLDDQSFDKADILVTRALASFPKLIQYGRPIVKPRGRLFVIKGSNYRQELVDFIYNPDALVEIPISKPWIKQSSYFIDKVFLQWQFEENITG